MDYLDGLKWVAEEYGLYAAIAVYFLGRDAWRDYKQDKVITSLQAEMRGVILPIVEKNAQVIAKNSSALHENTTALKDCRAAIQECKLAISTLSDA